MRHALFSFNIVLIYRALLSDTVEIYALFDGFIHTVTDESNHIFSNSFMESQLNDSTLENFPGRLSQQEDRPLTVDKVIPLLGAIEKALKTVIFNIGFACFFNKFKPSKAVKHTYVSM